MSTPMVTSVKQRPQVIVLTPIFNNALDLPRFLSVTSVFADYIILADQASTDCSREICSLFPKARYLNFPNDNLAKRRELLVTEARTILGPRLIMALDADEIPSATLLTSTEWNTVLAAQPGTIIGAPRIELWKTPHYYKPKYDVLPNIWLDLGYMDDGAPYHSGVATNKHGGHGADLPNNRLIAPFGHRWLLLNEIVILHYQTADWWMARSKNRWYRCLERSHDPLRNPTELHRYYLRTLSDNSRFPVQPSRSEWYKGWQELGIDVTSVSSYGQYCHWDWKALRLISEYGEQLFKYDDVWDVDWEQMRQVGLSLGIPDLPQKKIMDPRSNLDRYLTALCRRSQNTKWERIVDAFLRIMGR
jgi:hypothetical protein